jgi:ribosomal protein S18 acetylase RimI-like enzyme
MLKTKIPYTILTLILGLLCWSYVFAETEEASKERHLENVRELYMKYQSVNGTTFALYWEDPGKLNYLSRQQMRKLFIDSFIVQYRINKAMQNLTDEQLKKDLGHYFARHIMPCFRSDNKQWLLCAREKEKIVGFIFWEVLNESQAYVAELVISPDHWRQGLGRALMKSIFDKKPNIKKIVLLTEHKNHGAKNFYKALVYKPSIYIRKGYDVKDFCAYELET